MKKILYVFVFMLLTLGAFGQTTTIYLIRHTEKVDNSKNPDLSKAGLRTVQTATPTATSKNLEIIKYDPKTIDLEQLKKEHKGQAILIVGHSNTTPDLVNKIINQKVYAPIDDTVFGNLYIITISGNELSHQLLQEL